MNFNKIKKAAAAVIAAALCMASVLGVSVSAEDEISVFGRAELLTSTEYVPQYAKLLNKYAEKDKQKTIAYGKSKTKKFIDAYFAADTNNIKQYKLDIITEKQLISVAYCDNKIKLVMFDGGNAIAIYYEPEKITALNIETEEKTTVQTDRKDFDEAFDIVRAFPEILNDFNGYPENSERIKTYKFKSGKNVYFYEEIGEHNITGFLFNEDGELLAMGNGSECGCISASLSVDDSDFRIPSYYNEIDPIDFDF